MPRLSSKSALTKLKARRAAILENRIGKGAEAPVVDHPADFLAQASLGNIQNMSLLLRDKQLENLKEIDLAIERVASGEYGICLDCEDPIPLKRLEAFPEASLCLVCKRQAEESNKNEASEPWPDADMGIDFSIGRMLEQNVAL